MSAPGLVYNVYVQQGNRQVYLSWDITAGATSYSILKSTDGVNFTVLAQPVANTYIDTAVSTGVMYYYQVAAANVVSSQAAATMTFTGQPSVGNSFSLANMTFTAVASSATGNQFNIGATLANTLTNISNVVSAVLPTTVIPSIAGSVMTFTSFVQGLIGDSIQFSSGLANTTITAFSGGMAGSTGIYSPIQNIVVAPAAEMSLLQIRTMAMQRADRVGSNFVTVPEWNNFINQALYELYDLLITIDEEYFVAAPIQFPCQPNVSLYPLPDGLLTFTNGNTGEAGFVAPPFYKFKGQDLSLNTAQNAFVTVNKFTFIDRNRYVYPNTASTIYGVFNLQYRLQGNSIKFIPTPSANQNLQMWYIPRLPQMIADTDISTLGISGWLQYVIVRAAKYALNKEESDTTSLDQELIFLKDRIEATSANRDTGQPDRISDVRQNGQWGSMNGGYGNSGPIGGY